ncbi:MAG TPA: hypothetical protein VMM13_02785 [Euzebya sp.]|nr:hypothetical protein [Euzebya sp.]
MPSGPGSGLTLGRLARRVWPLVVLAFLVNCTVVAVALQAVGVPGDNEMIDFPVLLFASIGPVLGNAVGFFAAYRRPFALSLIAFLAPGLVITAVFVVMAVFEFDDHQDVGVLVTALLVTVLPTVVAVSGLLRARQGLIAGAFDPRGTLAAAPAGLLPPGAPSGWPPGGPGPVPTAAPQVGAPPAPTAWPQVEAPQPTPAFDPSSTRQFGLPPQGTYSEPAPTRPQGGRTHPAPPFDPTSTRQFDLPPAAVAPPPEPPDRPPGSSP